MALTKRVPAFNRELGENEVGGDPRDQAIAVVSRDAERTRLSVGYFTART